MEVPSTRDLELNEVRWWSNWANVRWLNEESYVLTSEAFREPFFNRAGSLSCDGVAKTAVWAERRFGSLGMTSTFMLSDSCVEGERALLRSGYSVVDTMTVLISRGAVVGREGGWKVTASPSAERWAHAYLMAFYGSAKLASSVIPVGARLQKAEAATLLEARVRGKTAGVLAIFRTRKLAGVYCVGTVQEFRKMGVATALLAKAKEIAESEGRTLILQTLASDEAGIFYAERGFATLYSKKMMQKPKMATMAKAPSLDLGVCIARNAPTGLSPFMSVFGGFERIGAVRTIFGRNTDEVLGKLKVEIAEGRGYLRINDEMGSIMVNSKYLKEGDEVHIYLDVIHELVHIRQHKEGKELWDEKYKYVDRPTELEAYRAVVVEGRRLGLSEDEIVEYLKVEWVSEDDFRRFLKNLGVGGGSGEA